MPKRTTIGESPSPLVPDPPQPNRTALFVSAATLAVWIALLIAVAFRVI